MTPSPGTSFHSRLASGWQGRPPSGYHCQMPQTLQAGRVRRPAAVASQKGRTRGSSCGGANCGTGLMSAVFREDHGGVVVAAEGCDQGHLGVGDLGGATLAAKLTGGLDDVIHARDVGV